MEIKPFLFDRKTHPLTLSELKETNEKAFQVVFDRIQTDFLNIAKLFEKLPNENGTIVRWTVLSLEFSQDLIKIKIQKKNGAKIMINKEAEIKANIRQLIDYDKDGRKGWMKENSKIIKKSDLADGWNFKKTHLKLGLKIIVMTLE